MKFLIVSPRQHSGGGIVQHLLCKKLMDRGHDARIFYIPDGMIKWTSYQQVFLNQLHFLRHDLTKAAKVKLFPYAKFIQQNRYRGYSYAPVRGCKRTYFPIVDDDTIVVYSEGIWGNFLHAKKIVRWFLYYNRYPNDEDAYEKDALYFDYMHAYNDEKLNPTGRKLYLGHFNKELYRQTNFGEREGKCYAVHKGSGRTDLPKEFNGPIVDGVMEAEVAKIFNKKKYLYSYDHKTFYNVIAAMCGCIPIFVPEPGKTRADYTKGEEEFYYGIAFGDNEDEIAYAISTRDHLKEELDKYQQNNEIAIDYFITECQRYFYGKQV